MLTALRVHGPYKGPSGYEHHVREFVRELHAQGVAIQLIDLPRWGPVKLPPELRDPWFETLDRPNDARVALHFCMPHQVVVDARLATVNYTMFEATRIPSRWVRQHLDHDLVIVPTESSRRAWVDSGVPADKLRLCPLGINPALFADPAPLPLRGADGQPLDRYRVRFLNVSELGPRKNLHGLLRAWLRATSREDDAVLILKLGAYAPGWLAHFGGQLDRLQARLGKRLSEAATVHFIYDLFSDVEMPRLHAAATHYVSLSFGEGWDQSMVEAAASGLRLIAPNHSAYTAYLDPSVAQLIPSREVPAGFKGGGDRGALFAGASWWAPDEDAAVGCIRRAIDGRDAPRASARERVLRDFTWSQATRRLLEHLSEAEARRTWRRFWPLAR